MPPIPADRFATLFRGLGPDDRAAFVAALWADRGWETTVDGKTVVARRDGDQERIRVANPGPFGTPALEGVDVLVAARHREAVQRAAAEAGVRYLGPADVRELLLYGLERPAAAALFERVFDQPLEPTSDPAPTLPERARTAGAVLGRAVTSRVGARNLVVLLLVGCVAGAALGAPTLTAQPEDRSVVAPVESVTPGDVGAVGERSTATAPQTGQADDDGDRPPGVGERALEDHVALADAHAEAVVGVAQTLRVEASGPPEAAFMRGRTAWNYTVRIEHSRHYRFHGVYQFAGENGSAGPVHDVGIYADGDTKYRRIQMENETTYQRYLLETTGDASGYATDVREFLVHFLGGESSTVECAATLTGGDCFAYRVVVTGAPAILAEDAAEYRAVAVVQDDGVVSSLAVRYTLPVDGERVPVTLRVTYDGFGATTVTPPPWLETAKNETGG